VMPSVPALGVDRVAQLSLVPAAERVQVVE
jgi:hypothetical protein